jgi:hypothetical protein
MNRCDLEMVLYNNRLRIHRRAALTKASEILVASDGVDCHIDLRFSGTVPFKVLIYTGTAFSATPIAQVLTDTFTSQLHEVTAKILTLETELLSQNAILELHPAYVVPWHIPLYDSNNAWRAHKFVDATRCIHSHPYLLFGRHCPPPLLCAHR